MAGRFLRNAAGAVVFALLAFSTACTAPAGRIESGYSAYQHVLLNDTGRVVSTPEIVSVDPPAQQAGEYIEIHGTGFGPQPGAVLLDGVAQQFPNWKDDHIAVELAGSPGLHELVIQEQGGETSAPVQFEILEDLYVEVSGIDTGHVYRFDEARPLTVTTNPDTEKVALLFYGIYGGEYDPPFSELQLPISTMPNGTHPFTVRAVRNSVAVESPVLMVTVYSLLGDIDGSGGVSVGDVEQLQTLIGMTSADPDFRPWYDPDGDGEVTEADLSAVGYHYGDHIPIPAP